jgi:hypothetical protein
MKTVSEMNYSLVIHPAVHLLRKQLAKKAKDKQKNNRRKKGQFNVLIFWRFSEHFITNLSSSIGLDGTRPGGTSPSLDLFTFSWWLEVDQPPRATNQPLASVA